MVNVIEIKNEEDGSVEYDVEVKGSDGENNTSALFYCKDKYDAKEFARRFNEFLKENQDLYECY